MQVFIVGTPLETAQALDKKRLHKQIVECRQILDALNGAKAWSNHPCVLQYEGYERWLEKYLNCLVAFVAGDMLTAKIESQYATDWFKPHWHTRTYYEQMKRRLYTKSPNHYSQWWTLGTSTENFYYVDGEWRIYENGKLKEKRVLL